MTSKMAGGQERSNLGLSDEEPVREKHRGQPRKKSKLDGIAFSQVEKMFEQIEQRLAKSLSSMISDAFAPL